MFGPTSLIWRAAAGLILFAAFAPDAGAAQVKGIVDQPAATPSSGRALGYTRTRVASPAVAARKADVALLLTAKSTLPIPPATDPFKVSISGLRFIPSVAACVVDGKIAFVNEDRAPITLIIEQKPFATIPPGEVKTYDCATPALKGLKLRAKEWPHMRGALFVGEIGVVGQPGQNNAFSLAAPQGKYELMLLAEEGPIATREVEIVRADVDVGRIGPPGATPEEPEVAPKGAVQRPPPRPRPPVEAPEGGDETEGTEP